MTDTKATLTLQGIPIVDAFLTGSCLVRSVTPQDIDICILFGCKADMTSFRKGKEECLPAALVERIERPRPCRQGGAEKAMTNREHAWRLLVTAAGCDGRISRAAAFELARKMCCGRTWADTTDEDHTEIIRRLTK